MVTEIIAQELHRLVQRFKVCWQVLPEWSRVGSERRQTALLVELFGTHDVPGIVPTVGCHHCIPVLRALLTIAEAAVPPEWRNAIYSIRAHSGIQYATERGGRPDIVVAITVIPDPMDFARCRDGVASQLTQLGASEGSWPDLAST